MIQFEVTIEVRSKNKSRKSKGGDKMKNQRLLVLFLALAFALAAIAPVMVFGQQYGPEGSGKVVFIIQSSDPELVFYGLLMAHRAIKNQWLDEVKIVFWGPSEKVIAELPDDSPQRKLVKEIMAMGGKSARIWCCKACSDKYGVTEKLEKLGFEVFHVGNTTSYLIKLGFRPWNW